MGAADLERIVAMGNVAQPDLSAQEYGAFVLPQHAALLRASGITPEVAVARGYKSADTRATLARYGFSKAQRIVPGLLIPVYGMDGRIRFYQYRPDDPRFNGEGKPVKYETPPNVRMAVDAHPMIRNQLGDPQHPLFVTEGIRKADAAISRGLCCVALLGVWNWRGRNTDGGKVALPEWELIALEGRQVYLIFDSDVMVKPQVYKALTRLKAFLELRKGRVQLIYLPAGPNGEKVGLDDFLASGHSPQELLVLTTDAMRTPPTEDKEDGATSRQTQGRELVFRDPEPWPQPVDSGKLLEALVQVLTRYVVLPAGAATAVALWIMLAYAIDAIWILPILVLTSPVMRCGKTTLLRLLQALVRRPLLAANVSSAALFRVVEKFTPTLLADEGDTWVKLNDELRGLLNAGHTRSTAVVVRVVGDDYEPRLFSTWCAKAIALVGKLPATLEDRAIVIPMRRAAPGERVEELREDRLGAEMEQLRRAAMRWTADHLDALRRADPVMPDGLHARAADNWRPLLEIADLAGGEWPQRARQAAVTLSGLVEEADTSPAVRLLTDIWTVFTEQHVDRLPTEALLEALHGLPESPWREWRRGKPLSASQLAGLLRGFEIRPGVVRIGDRTPRGYTLEGMADALTRYLHPSNRNSATEQAGRGDPQLFEAQHGRNIGDDVAAQESINPASDAACCDVALREGAEGPVEVDNPVLADGGRLAVALAMGRNLRWPQISLGDGQIIPAGEAAWRAFCANGDQLIDRALEVLEGWPNQSRAEEAGVAFARRWNTIVLSRRDDKDSERVPRRGSERAEEHEAESMEDIA